MSSISLELVFNGKRQFQELDVLSFVRKPIEHFVYKPTIKDTRIPLTYVQTRKLFSNHNILINDHSSSIASNINNYDFFDTKYYNIVGPSLSTVYSSIRITNRKKLDLYNREVPLFFKHETDGMTNASLEIETNMNASLNKVYDIDYSANSVFHNYENFFNEDTGEYRLYYLNYINRDNESVRELLDTKDVVYELTWKDIDPFTGHVKVGVEGYEKVDNTVDYTYYFNVPGEHWWAPTSDNNINLFIQKGRSSKEPWYLGITNGSSSKVINNILYRYSVNEYYQQNFSPRFPLVYSVFFELDYVNQHTLRSDTDNIFYSKEENLHLDIMVYNEDNSLIRVLTTDPVKANKRYEDTNLFWEGDIITSVDEENGFVALGEQFSPKLSYKGSFFHSIKHFEYKKINLNPNYNKRVKDKMYVIYCVPNLLYYETAIHYLIVNKSGRIDYCSQGDGNKYERANYPCLSIRDEDGKYNPDTIVGAYYKNSHEGPSDSFVELYSCLGENAHNYLILGEVSFRESTNFDEILSFDVSKEGNMIKDSEKNKVYRNNYKLLQSEYGYGRDGYNYTLQNSSLLEVPLNLMNKYGGPFTEESLMEMIEDRMPSQCFTSIDWVFPKSRATVDNSKEKVIDIKIEYAGKDCIYMIYRKESKMSKFEKIGEISPSGTGPFFFQDDGVDSLSTYWYKVCVNKSGVEYPSVNEIEVYVK